VNVIAMRMPNLDKMFFFKDYLLELFLFFDIALRKDALEFSVD
jgi:hypothetical protein